MNMLNVLILSTAIGIGASSGLASERDDAIKALAKATYKEADLDKYVKHLEKKYIPKELKEYGGWITGTTKLVIEKKISGEWTF